MNLPDILARYNPEAEFLNLDLPVDRLGEPYLLLEPDFLMPVKFDLSQPGKGIMVHVMDETRNSIDYQLDAIKKEGFVAPRRYANFSTSAFEWGVGEKVSVVACRTESRWSREYLDPQEIKWRKWSEGLIGLTIEEAEDIAPRGVEYFLKKHPKDKDGYRADYNRKKISQTGILAYIPPAHFLGCVRFSNTEYNLLIQRCQDQIEKYIGGSLTEREYGDWLSGATSNKTVEPVGDTPEASDGESFWYSIAAAYTQSALLEEISNQTKGKVGAIFSEVKTSYPITTSMKEDALVTFGDF